MSDLLVNSIYPASYFTLASTDLIPYPDQYWWSSVEQFAAHPPGNPSQYLSTKKGGIETTDYLEIDLGYVRQINYINLQIMRMPIDITIYYDPVSDNDGDQFWIPASRLGDGMPYDNRIFYDANTKNAWQNAEFYLTDGNDNMVTTRWLRFAFKRRDESWPTTNANPFKWAVSVKNLRTGRIVTDLTQVDGLLLDLGISDQPLPFNGYPISQAFSIDADEQRGNITPNITGFSILVNTTSLTNDVPAADLAPKIVVHWTLRANGSIVAQGNARNPLIFGQTWLDVFLDPDNYQIGDPNIQYTLECSTPYPADTLGLYVNDNNTQGGLTYTAIDSHGNPNTITDSTTTIALRIWGDVADQGRDVLGNFYRYGTRYDAPENALTGTSPGWYSAPQPSTEAVESLFFDVRQPDISNPPNAIVNQVGAQNTLTAIDAIRIAPATPGMRMHIYYSQSSVDGLHPNSRFAWDNLIWIPINQTFVLHGQQTITLPTQISASYVKLEFSKLQPLPFRLPSYPKLPPVSYQRYPTWIESQFDNAQIRRTVQDWFVQNRTSVMTDVLKTMRDPILAFQYKEREFLAALALGQIKKSQVNSSLIDTTTKTLIDPTTGSRIQVHANDMYQGTLFTLVDGTSVLGNAVSDFSNPNLNVNPVESAINFTDRIPAVSTSNDRVSESFAHLAKTPLWFNQTCRHHYKTETAFFNKKAFFAGIKSVEFLRQDYTQAHDDTVISESLLDPLLLEENSFIGQSDSLLSTLQQQTAVLYLSYTSGGTIVGSGGTLPEEQPLLAPGNNWSYRMHVTNGPAFNIQLRSAPNGQGTLFSQPKDFDVIYGKDENTGQQVNYLVVSRQVVIFAASLAGNTYVDSATILGQAVITSHDEYGHTVNEGALAVGIARPSALEQATLDDANTVIGVAAVGVLEGTSITVGSAVASASAGSETAGAQVGNLYIDPPGGSPTAATETGVAVIAPNHGSSAAVGRANTDDIYSHNYVDPPATSLTAATVVGVAIATPNLGSSAAVGRPIGDEEADFVDGSAGAATNLYSAIVVHQGGSGSDSINTVTNAATYPDAEAVGSWVRWSTLQPTETVPAGGSGIPLIGFAQGNLNGGNDDMGNAINLDKYVATAAYISGSHSSIRTSVKATLTNTGNVSTASSTYSFSTSSYDALFTYFGKYGVQLIPELHFVATVSGIPSGRSHYATPGLTAAGYMQQYYNFVTDFLTHYGPASNATFSAPGWAGVQYLEISNEPNTATGNAAYQPNTNSQVQSTTLTHSAAAGNTSLQVQSTAGFNPNEGRLKIGSDVIYYTGITATTFTGIPASGGDAVASAIANGATVSEVPCMSNMSNIYRMAKAARDAIDAYNTAHSTSVKLIGPNSGSIDSYVWDGLVSYAANPPGGGSPLPSPFTIPDYISVHIYASVDPNTAGTSDPRSIDTGSRYYNTIGTYLRPLMNSNGGTNTGIFITEGGYAGSKDLNDYNDTSHALSHHILWENPSQAGVGEHDQETWTTAAINLIQTNNASWKVQGLYQYTLIDFQPDSKSLSAGTSTPWGNPPNGGFDEYSMWQQSRGMVYNANAPDPTSANLTLHAVPQSSWKGAATAFYNATHSPQVGGAAAAVLGTPNFVWPTGLDVALDDARANNYKIPLRISCGSDAPSWIATDGAKPVQMLPLIDTAGTRTISVPVPWDANLLYWYQTLLTQMQPYLAGTTPNGTTRSSYIYFVPVTMASTTSADMTFSYGVPAVYAGTLTTNININSATSSFVLQGGNPDSLGYPINDFLCQIDSELLMCNRPGVVNADGTTSGSSTVTITAHNWIGTNGASLNHALGSKVTYITSGNFGTGDSIQTFNGRTGIFDIAATNKVQWLTVATLPQAQTNILNAWKLSIDAFINTITNITGIPTCVVFSDVFGDNYQTVALPIAQTKVNQYPTRLWSMVPNLQPGNNAGTPTKINPGTGLTYPTYYEGWSPYPSACLHAAVNNGGTIGFAVASVTAWSAFTNSFSGAGSAFRLTIEDTLANWNPEFIEASPSIINTGP